MSKFHINDEGNPGPCSAEFRCPFGDLDDDHFSSPQEARDAYEVKMNNQMIETLIARNSQIEKARNSFVFTEEQLALQDTGDFDYDIAHFERKPSGYDYDQTIWTATLDDVPEDMKLDVRFNENTNRAFLDIGDESIKIAEKDTDESTWTPEGQAEFLAHAVEVAKKEHSEHFDKKRNDRIIAHTEQYESGSMTIRGSEFNRTGYVAPEIWESNMDDVPEIDEVYIRVRHGVAAMRIRQAGANEPDTLHSMSLNSGDGSFGSDHEAGRFIEEGERKLADYIRNMRSEQDQY